MALCPFAVAGNNQCQPDVDLCSDIANATLGNCTNTPSGFTCGCSPGFAWNSSAKLCADEDGCSSSPCGEIPYADAGGCTDVEAPGTGFNCQCQAGYTWNESLALCVGERLPDMTLVRNADAVVSAWQGTATLHMATVGCCCAVDRRLIAPHTNIAQPVSSIKSSCLQTLASGKSVEM
jgi:hypothetical protein